MISTNTNFYSLWFDPTGNGTQVYRFSSRRSIHSTTDRLINSSVDNHQSQIGPSIYLVIRTKSTDDVQTDCEPTVRQH